MVFIIHSRYIAIVHPLHYSRYMTKVVTRLLMSATWSVALCISCIPIFWNDWEDGVSCEMNEVSKAMSNVPTVFIVSLINRQKQGQINASMIETRRRR